MESRAAVHTVHVFVCNYKVSPLFDYIITMQSVGR